MREDNLELLQEENKKLKAKLESIDCKDNFGLIETFVEEKIKLQIENQRLKIKLEKLQKEKEMVEYEEVETTLDINIINELKELKEKYEELSLAYNDLLNENDFLEKQLQDKQNFSNVFEVNELIKEKHLEIKTSDITDIIEIETNDKSDKTTETISKNEESFLDSLLNNEEPILEEKNYDISDLFMCAKAELNEEKVIIDKTKKLLPMVKFYSKEYLESNKSIFLDQIKYFSTNKNIFKTEELFRFLVSFTFYYYREGNLWNNLMIFFDIEEDYGNTLREYVKEITNTNNFILIKNELSDSTEIVETLKLHARMPIFYLGSFLQDLYQIYIKLSRNINKDIFFDLLEERIKNDGHLSNLKTIKTLYKYNQKNDLFDFSYELITLIDKLDRNLDYTDIHLFDDIKNETKLWYETDYKYSYTKHIYDKFNDKNYKEPKISTDYYRNKIKVEEFCLPLEEIEELYLRIYSYKDKKEESRKVHLNYFQNAEKYEIRKEEINITKEETLGRYEIYLNNNLIFEKDSSYLLLDENGDEIRNIKTLKDDKFTLLYLNKYYEVLSESDIQIEEYTSDINRVNLNKQRLNYLRNKYNKKTILNLSSRETKEVNILFSSIIENFKVDNVKVITSLPMINGFIEDNHILYHNGKRMDIFDFDTSIIGKNSLKIINKNTNRVMKEENYVYIPDLNIEFCFYDKTDKIRPFVYGEFDEAFIEINSKYVKDIKGLYDFSNVDDLHKINLTEEEIKKEVVEFTFIIFNVDYSGNFIMPKLTWNIENKEYSNFVESFWKEDLSKKLFKAKLNGVNSFNLKFVENSLEMGQFGIKFDFINDLVELSREGMESFKINFLYKGKKYNEILFDLILKPIVEEEQHFLIHSDNNADKLEIIYQNGTIDEIQLSSNDFLKLDKNNFSGEVTFNLIKENMFGFSSEVISTKTFMLNRETINPGDKFQVSQLITKEGEIVEIDGEIIFQYLHLDDHKNIVAKILESAKDVYFNGRSIDVKKLKISYSFDYIKLTASYIKVVGKEVSVPLRYLLGAENKLRALEISPNDKGENANYKLILKKL